MSKVDFTLLELKACVHALDRCIWRISHRRWKGLNQQAAFKRAARKIRKALAELEKAE